MSLPSPSGSAHATCIWPEGKQFAFSIFDDTDAATFENVSSVYSFLADCGFRTTKSCWVFRGDRQKGTFPGRTLDDGQYRQWLVDLQAKGFMIGWHGATWHEMPRDKVAKAMERFAEVFGQYPKTATSHTAAGDAMYWGKYRFTGWRRRMYSLLRSHHEPEVGAGHVEGDPYFWGDLCQQRIKYYRNFVFEGINTLKACPFIPYHDTLKPYVNYWFTSSNGNRIKRFNECLAEAAQDRLEEEGGACIVYTHLACGFADGGRIEPRFRALMERLAKKNGWFVPVGTLLDHLLAVNGHHNITNAERRHLEHKWLLQRIRIGRT